MGENIKGFSLPGEKFYGGGKVVFAGGFTIFCVFCGGTNVVDLW
jgi:hypothetical protein